MWQVLKRPLPEIQVMFNRGASGSIRITALCDELYSRDAHPLRLGASEPHWFADSYGCRAEPAPTSLNVPQTTITPSGSVRNRILLPLIDMPAPFRK